MYMFMYIAGHEQIFISKQLCKSRDDLIQISANISHYELVFHFFSYFHDVMMTIHSWKIIVSHHIIIENEKLKVGYP